jgi:hypothetical protein
MSTEERRAPGATRIPFDALVEVGGALGPTFEAQAVNVSEEGIHLRTAYLPEPGQPLTCRFDTGAGNSVLAAGEVAWSTGVDRGGEFGVRFTEVDAESVDALKRICGVMQPAAALPGSKVRLHIDGLASPMRAKIRDSQATAVTVGSDLGFLQVGRQLELEDAQSGTKRPANIDRVAVSLDPASNVPQLIVTLRYADADPAAADAPASESPTAKPAARASAARASSPATPPDDLAAVEQAGLEMKGAVARAIDNVGPAVGRFAERAKTMVAVLAQRGFRRPEETAEAGPRRTTAPPPGGGLHATGRRVVRGESAAPLPTEAVAAPGGLKISQRRLVLAGGVMTAAIIGALALKKAHHDPAPPPVTEATNAATSASAPAPAAPAASVAQAPAAPDPVANTAPIAAGPPSNDGDDTGDEHSHHRHVHVAPFSNGPVHHGNVLHLKMDGPIESIEGAQQPTGFVVKVPGRKAVEPAAPLAARDERIAAIKVTNESAGADLAVTFKDGVPNYRVSARGDTLAISLAPIGPIDAPVAKKDEKGAQSGKHPHHSHSTSTKKSEQDL